MPRNPDYGIDSPAIIAGLFIAGLVFAGVSFFLPHLFHLPMRWIAMVAAIYSWQGAAGMLVYSKVGKLQMREQFLDSIPWRGDEQVLDVGCGRGLLLIAAARRLTTGRAIGVDVWAPGAITANRPEAILENAELEGVRGRIQVKEGDARQLPFSDASFDIVVSNFVLHEMDTDTDREKTVREIARVLKPGGHVALRDFIFTEPCVQELQRFGVEDARRERVGRFSFWVGAILNFGFFQLYHVTGKKAPAKRTA